VGVRTPPKLKWTYFTEFDGYDVGLQAETLQDWQQRGANAFRSFHQDTRKENFIRSHHVTPHPEVLSVALLDVFCSVLV